MESGEKYEGGPKNNANSSVISSMFGIFLNSLHIYYGTLAIL